MCIYRVDRHSNHVDTCWSSLSRWVILYLCVEQFKRVYLCIRHFHLYNTIVYFKFRLIKSILFCIGTINMVRLWAITTDVEMNSRQVRIHLPVLPTDTPRNLPLIAIGSGDTRTHSHKPRNLSVRTRGHSSVHAEEFALDSNWLGWHADTLAQAEESVGPDARTQCTRRGNSNWLGWPRTRIRRTQLRDVLCISRGNCRP